MKNINYCLMICLFAIVCLIPKGIFAQEGPKEATEWTIKANQAVLADPVLNWADKKDFENVQRGFMGRHTPLTITDPKGNILLDMEAYTAFIKPDAPAPNTVNSSLWRHAQLNTSAGLFKITERIYQVRGYDLACMAIIEGDTGYVVIDTLTTIEESKKALELVYEKLGRKPIRAVVITHSHADHFGGVTGVVTAEEVKGGKVKIVAPAGFTKAALSENILAGPAMGRRASYQFGVGLPVGPKGAIDSGLGKSRIGGTISFLPPTDTVNETGQKMTLDGVEFIFEMSPETEAPSEMEFYLPQFKTLCVAENVNQTAHNLYPMRGTLTRDAKAWAGYINQMIELFPEAEIAFGVHFWPVWGKAEVRNWLKKQRDMYKYLHDQTLRLANQGYTGAEISQMVQLPPSLASEWFNRDYYGAIQNNVRAIYTRYLGWYDGNPANLNPLPPAETAQHLVEYMGGAEAALARARKSFEAGEYRWVAQVMNLVVFADPKNMAARNLEADAMEQLGYQQESSTWRNAYLLGAQELRREKSKGPIRRTISMFTGMAESDLLELLTVSLNGPKANGKTIFTNLVFTDLKTKYLLTLENSVLNYFKDRQDPQADITIVTDKPSFIKLVLLGNPLPEVLQSGQLTLSGKTEKFKELMGLLDDSTGDFNIVLPRMKTN
jgi:alkyl sulfatase BDS1-like metallo-beta-lactamase superfamily hydrolase